MDVESDRAYRLFGRTDLHQYARYEDTLTIPAPPEYDEFACDLLFYTNLSALIESAHTGSNNMKRVAWERVARGGDRVELINMAKFTDKVPPLWMIESHHLYDITDLREVLVLNSLSLLDVPEIAYRVTGEIGSYKTPDGPSVRAWNEMGRPGLALEGFTSLDALAISFLQRNPSEWDPIYLEATNPAVFILSLYDPSAISDLHLEDVLVSCVSEVDREYKRHPRSLLNERQLSLLAQSYGVEESLPSTLMSILTLETENDPSGIHFSNIVWMKDYSPWLILSSPLEQALGLAVYPIPYEILMRAGSDRMVNDVMNRLEPTRAALAQYYRGK